MKHMVLIVGLILVLQGCIQQDNSEYQYEINYSWRANASVVPDIDYCFSIVDELKRDDCIRQYASRQKTDISICDRVGNQRQICIDALS